MTVGQFNESYPPIMDGVGMVTKQYATWLDRKYGKGVAVTVQMPEVDTADEVDGEGPEVLRVNSVPVPGMPPYRAPLPGLSPQVRKRLDEIPFDIVHSHAPFRLGRMALSIARARNIPMVTTFHSKYREDFQKALPGFLVPAAMRYILKFYAQVDMVWVPNQATIDTIREYGHHGPVEVMYNGTDLQLPDDIDSYRQQGEAFAGIPSDHKMLLYIGQHRWEKNLKLMLEALKVARSAGGAKSEPFSMAFVGQGYAERELVDLAKELGIDDIVHFLGVVRDREVIKQLFARSDLFLFPSLYDTSPLTLREAAAFHVPTLLVEGASATEGITDGQNGFIAPNDATEYGAAIRRVLGDSRTLEAVGQGAFDTLFRTWEQVADEVHERYLGLIEQKKSQVS